MLGFDGTQAYAKHGLNGFLLYVCSLQDLVNKDLWKEGSDNE